MSAGQNLAKFATAASWPVGAVLVSCAACGSQGRPLKWVKGRGWVSSCCGAGIEDETPTPASAGGGRDAPTSQAARKDLA